MADRIRDILNHRMTVLLLLLLGGLIRLVQLNSGLWLDEIWSMRTSSPEQSIASIISACRADTHPPLFDLMLSGWLSIFGDSPLNGRWLGFFWGMMGLFATWFYALRLSKSRVTAFFAVGLLAFNYFHVYYSNEVRFYSFIYVASLIATSHLYLYLKEHKTIHLVAVVLAGWTLLYTHYFGAFLLSALGIGLLILLKMREIDTTRFWWVVGAGLVIIIGFIPWIRWIPMGGGGTNWISTPSPTDFAVYIYNYTGKNPVEFIIFLVGIAGAIGVFKKHRKLLVLLFSAVTLGYVIPLLVSYFLTPILHERYTMIYFPALVLIAAIGITSAGRWNTIVRAGLMIALWISIGINLSFIHPYFGTDEKEPWRSVAEAVEREPLPLYTNMGFWADYYLEQSGMPPSYSIDQALAHGNGPFWVLKTPYERTEVDENEFHPIDSLTFRNGFVLVRCR